MRSREVGWERTKHVAKPGISPADGDGRSIGAEGIGWQRRRLGEGEAVQSSPVQLRGRRFLSSDEPTICRGATLATNRGRCRSIQDHAATGLLERERERERESQRGSARGDRRRAGADSSPTVPTRRGVVGVFPFFVLAPSMISHARSRCGAVVSLSPARRAGRPSSRVRVARTNRAAPAARRGDTEPCATTATATADPRAATAAARRAGGGIHGRPAGRV